MEELQLIYSLVVCKQVPVAECATHAGTFKKYCFSILPTVNKRVKQATYRLDTHAFHVLNSTNRNLLYICVTPTAFSASHAFTFLTEVAIQFEQEFQDEILDSTPLPYEMNRDFAPFMLHSMKMWNKTFASGAEIAPPPGKDAANQVQEFELDALSLRRRTKTPFLVQSTRISSKTSAARSVQQESAFSRWLARHPYLMIGFCIFIGLILLLYFVVVVPLCGYDFMRMGEDHKYVCWFR